jgi:hypothetical protein
MQTGTSASCAGLQSQRSDPEKAWEKTLNLAEGTKQERKGLSDFTQSM